MKGNFILSSSRERNQGQEIDTAGKQMLTPFRQELSKPEELMRTEWPSLEGYEAKAGRLVVRTQGEDNSCLG